MKKFVFICCLLLCCIGCISQEQRAKKLIKEELRTTLHDFKSYEAVTFGSLDSIFTDFTDTPTGDSIFKEMNNRASILKMKISETNEALDDYKNEYNERLQEYYRERAIKKYNELQILREEVDKDPDILLELISNHVPEFKGWKMNHSFRSKTLGSNYKLAHQVYYFNIEISKITKSFDVDDED
jgi:hypothetical protein